MCAEYYVKFRSFYHRNLRLYYKLGQCNLRLYYKLGQVHHFHWGWMREQ